MRKFSFQISSLFLLTTGALGYNYNCKNDSQTLIKHVEKHNSQLLLSALKSGLESLHHPLNNEYVSNIISDDVSKIQLYSSNNTICGPITVKTEHFLFPTICEFIGDDDNVYDSKIRIPFRFTRTIVDYYFPIKTNNDNIFALKVTITNQNEQDYISSISICDAQALVCFNIFLLI